MTVTEAIYRHVQKLPEFFQTQVLDFVEYLLAKAEWETAQRDEQTWSSLSLALAMRDMEKEDAPAFSAADLKEVFS